MRMIPNHDTILKEGLMNTILIFMVRLILGLVFGIILARLFKPDWEIYHGAILGVSLVAMAYGFTLFRTKKE